MPAKKLSPPQRVVLNAMDDGAMLVNVEGPLHHAYLGWLDRAREPTMVYRGTFEWLRDHFMIKMIAYEHERRQVTYIISPRGRTALQTGLVPPR